MTKFSFIVGFRTPDVTARPTIDPAFFQHLTAEDELGVVLRAQIHIEAGVNDLLNSLVPRPDDLPRLQFEGRVRLACSLGLSRKYLEPLKSLGDLRNRFAHRLDARLDDQIVNSLYSKLSKGDQSCVLEAYRATANPQAPETPPNFEKLPPKDRFVLIAVVLKGMITVAVHNAKQLRERA